MKTLITTITVGLVAAAANAQLLFDDFNDTAIDSSKWSTITRAAGASVSESGGSAKLHNRGTLISLQNFTTYDITGRFQFTGSGSDRFIAWTRTSGISTNVHSDLDDGVVFRFQQDISKVGIDVWNSPVNQTLAEAPVSLPNNTWFNYRVTDDSTNVALYFNDLNTPAITASTNFISGNKAAFNNALFDVTTEMDYVQIVPEPTSSAFLLVSASFMLSVRRRRTTHCIQS